MSEKFRQILTCQLSPCQRYRYLLRVAVLPTNSHSRSLTVILKNPSTADANRGDPTTGKVEAWARHHGYDTVTYLNLFALRSPYPRMINTVGYGDAVGAENDSTLQHSLSLHQSIVIGWGNPNGIDPYRYQQRIAEIQALLSQSPAIVHFVGSPTLAGYPRHGLQWRKEMEIERLGDWEIVSQPRTISQSLISAL